MHQEAREFDFWCNMVVTNHANTNLLSAILNLSLPKSALKFDHFGHLDLKHRSFKYLPRTPSNKKNFDQKLSFTHRGSYKVKNHLTITRCWVILDFVFFGWQLTLFLFKIHFTVNPFYISIIPSSKDISDNAEYISGTGFNWGYYWVCSIVRK